MKFIEVYFMYNKLHLFKDVVLTVVHTCETTNTIKGHNLSIIPNRFLVSLCQSLPLPPTQATTDLFSVNIKEFIFM